jgi:hypothetical protein
MGFEICLWEQSHIYTQVLQLFTEIIAPPPNAIYIHAMTLSDLWTLEAIFFIKYSFCTGHYCVFFWHSFTGLCDDLLLYSGDF